MTKIALNNKLTARAITLEETNELLAAVETIELREQEIQRAQKALQKANEALNILLATSLKQLPLKWMEGEVVSLSNYHKLFCYLHEDFISISLPEGYINEGIL